jgi:hypothetical protein
MEKKIGINEVLFLMFCFIGFFGLLMLCGEPKDFSEQSLYDYEHYYDKGNFGWYMLRGWFSLIGLWVIIFVYKIIKK